MNAGLQQHPFLALCFGFKSVKAVFCRASNCIPFPRANTFISGLPPLLAGVGPSMHSGPVGHKGGKLGEMMRQVGQGGAAVLPLD